MIEPEEQASALDGLEAAYKGRPIPPLPAKLAEAIGWLGPQVSLPLRLKIGNPDAKSAALAALENLDYPDQDLAALLEVLANTRLPEALEPLLARLTQHQKSLGPLSRQAIWPALQLFDDPRIAKAVLASLSQTPSASEQPFNLLASRASWSRQLVDAVQTGQLDPKNIPVTVVRRLKQHRDPELTARAANVWPGTGSPTTAEVEKTIARLTNVAKAPGGDPYRGRDLFQASCSACHRLHGDGGSIGPDLTSYQRDDLSALLTAIVNPNAEIREGYENLTITTRDGRVLSGFLAEQDGQTLTLRGLDGRLSVLEKAALAEKTPTGASLMPEGLLQSFDEAQVRDLFAYLRSTQPLPPRRK